MSVLLALSRLAILASLGAIVALVESGAIFGAIIAGAFMLANTLLTIYLTNRIKDEARRRPRRRR